MLAAWLKADLRVVLRATTTVVLTVTGCASCVGAWLLVTSPIDDIAGVEPYVVYTLAELNAGLSLYTDPERAPFSITQYSPLYYLFVHAVGRAVGSDTALELTTLGRAVSCGFLVAQLGLVYSLLTRVFALRGVVVWTVLVALMVTTAPWQVCARPDAMLSFFSLMTLLCVVNSTGSKHPTKWLLVAACVAGVSVFVKQSGIVNVAAVLAVSRLDWRARTLFWLCLTVAACVGAGLVWCGATWGPAFFSNAVTGVRNGVQLDPALLDTFTTLTGLYLPLLLCAVYVAVLTLAGKWGDGRLRPVAVFALVTLVLASGLALKRGSAINYFNDFFVFALVLVAVWAHNHGALQSSRESSQVPSLSVSSLSVPVRVGLTVGVLVWIATLFVRNLAVPVGYARAARGGEHDYTVLVPLGAKLRQALEREGGYAVTRNAGLAATLAPMAILPMPAITDQLYAEGLLDVARVEQWLTEHRVTYEIVTPLGNTHWYGPVTLQQTWCAAQTQGALVVNAACSRGKSAVANPMTE